MVADERLELPLGGGDVAFPEAGFGFANGETGRQPAIARVEASVFGERVGVLTPVEEDPGFEVSLLLLITSVWIAD